MLIETEPTVCNMPAVLQSIWHNVGILGKGRGTVGELIFSSKGPHSKKRTWNALSHDRSTYSDLKQSSALLHFSHINKLN